MYLVYCLLIWTFLYTFPALALFPKLITSPKSALAIPILSTLLMYLLTTMALAFGVFNEYSLSAFVLACAGVAVFRLRSVIINDTFSWHRLHIHVYLICALIMLPYFIKLGTHGFERGDEIYSWNFWAIQHYFQEAIDFSHTGAPYPQLFPKILAMGYHILGNIDLQVPLKATLVIFPYIMITAIGVIAVTDKKDLLKYLFGLFYVMVLAGLEQFFDDGYADPIMTSCLVVSLALFWLSQRDEAIAKNQLTQRLFLLGSVLCAITCAHAKQAGLLYTLLSLPVLILCCSAKDKAFYRSMALLSFVGGLCWVLGEGSSFHQNKGVIWLSSGNRDLWAQLLYSINKYFVHKPFLFLLFAATAYFAFKDRLTKILFFSFILPALVCWFLFGAYQLRLGQHIIAVALLVICIIPSPILWERVLKGRVRGLKPIYLTITIISLTVSTFAFTKEYWIPKNGTSLYQGGKISLIRYFGQDTDRIYNEIYTHPQLLLWVPSRYLYGLFYHHTQLTTPDYLSYKGYNAQSLIQELQIKQPDYVFTVAPEIIDGPASEILSSVIAQCPQPFTKIANSPNRFSFMTYKVDKQLLKDDQCLTRLAKKGYTQRA